MSVASVTTHETTIQQHRLPPPPPPVRLETVRSIDGSPSSVAASDPVSAQSAAPTTVNITV
jgi:hypothetical protein